MCRICSTSTTSSTISQAACDVPPYLKPIQTDRCVKCNMVAVWWLTNERNAPIAPYCKLHGPPALDAAKKEFLERPR